MKHLKILRKYKTDLLVFFFFLLFLPLFLYNLGGFGLTDFDEAWYAEIGRNVLKNKDPILLTFNESPYSEHPPLGFDLIALSFLIFGVSEFAARFPSAILGWGCLILTYLIGKHLVNRLVGIGASLMLVSSVWFMFRGRSGNLDTIFLFFYLLTFYCAVKIKNDPKWIYALAASFAAVLLVKSVIGVTILLPIFAYFFVERIKFSEIYIFASFVIFLLCLSPWIVKNLLKDGLWYFQHMILVGLRPGFRIMPNLAELFRQTTFQYLHFGIGKWYKLGLVALVGLLPFIKRVKTLIPVYVLIIFLLFGFLTNAKTEIWHLIPIYPFWGIVIAAFLYFCINYFILRATSQLAGSREVLSIYSSRQARTITSFLTIIPIFLLSFYQIYQFRYGIKLFDSGLGGLASVSQEARDYKEDLYLDGHDFLPSAVFYSQKRVQHIRGLAAPRNLLKGFITEASASSLLLTQKWRLELDKIDPSLYETLAQKEDWMLVRVASPSSK